MTDAREIEDALADYIAQQQAGDTQSAAAFVAARMAARTKAEPDFEQRLLSLIRAFEATERELPDLRSILPDTIDGWRVFGFVGQGSFGKVFRVRAEASDAATQDLALKILHCDSVLRPRALERFRREGEALSRLVIEGIVRCHAFGVFEGCPYLVLDLVEGPTLEALIEEARRSNAGPRSLARERAVGIIAKLARALDELHRCGLFHRDVKPGNVVIAAGDGQPCLIDFGLVGGESARSSAATTLTQEGDIVGTPAYMAPEQASGAPCDARTDIHALGLMLFEVLTLELPRGQRGTGAPRDEIRQQRQRHERMLEAEIDEALVAIHDRATATFPRHRYVRALDMALDLEAVAAGRPPRQATAIGRRLFEVQALRPWLLPSVAALFLVAVGLLLWTAERSRVRTRTTQTLHAIEAAITGRRSLAEDLDVGARARSAIVAWANDDKALAFETAQRLATEEPENGYAAFVTGVMALGTRRFTEAKQALGNAARAFDDIESCQRLYLRALRLAGSPAEARVRADELIQRSEGALDAETWHEIARVAFVARDARFGLRAIQAAIAACEGPPSLAMLNTAAILHAGAGDRQGAAAHYALIHRRDPNYVVGRFNEAHHFDKDCRLEEAREAYEAVVALDPGHAQALASLAWLHSGSGRDSCETCKAAFEANPRLFDPDLAEAKAIAAVEASIDPKVLNTVLQSVLRIDRRTGLLAALERIQQRAQLSDEDLGRVTRAIRRLSR